MEYTWETAAGHRTLPTQRRTSLKQLPRHLIIELKRFVFDFDTMNVCKVFDRFEFPRELDMTPYTVTGRDAAFQAACSNEAATSGSSADSNKPNNMYCLVGMVIHSGSADAGQHYVIARERIGDKFGGWVRISDSGTLHMINSM